MIFFESSKLDFRGDVFNLGGGAFPIFVFLCEVTVLLVEIIKLLQAGLLWASKVYISFWVLFSDMSVHTRQVRKRCAALDGALVICDRAVVVSLVV